MKVLQFRETPSLFGVGCLLVVSTRIAAWMLGLGPNDALLTHWQTRSLDILAAEPLHALLTLYSQPPFWNAFVSVFAYVCRADIGCASAGITGLFVVLTILQFVIVYRLIHTFTKSDHISLFGAIVFAISPSEFYYENYPFYPHLTQFFFTLFAYNIVRYSLDRHPSRLIAAELALAALSRTWTAFHPLWLIPLMFAMAIIGGGSASALIWERRRALIITAAVSMVVLLPIIRNMMFLGIPAGGLWAGYNLASAVGGMEECDLLRILLEKRKEGDSRPPGEVLNDIELAAQSKLCAERAVAEISERPADFIVERIAQVMRSHSLWSVQYMFKPRGWERMGFPSASSLHGEVGAGFVTRVGAIIYYSVAWVCAAALVLRSSLGERRGAWLVLAAMACFVSVIHFGNGGEQQRMRYTVEAVLWALAVAGAYGILRNGRKIVA